MMTIWHLTFATLLFKTSYGLNTRINEKKRSSPVLLKIGAGVLELRENIQKYQSMHYIQTHYPVF